jgi:hypothetical protein
MLLLVRAVWSLSGTDAEKDADVAARPLIADGFVEDHGSRIVFPCAFVEEHGLADLDGLEGQCCGGCCAASLPYCSVGLDGGLFA